jgi:translation initiation factor 2A
MWHVSGSFLYNEEMNELYHVTWRPESTEKHPLGNPLANVPTPHESAAAHLATKKAPSKPMGAYRPPGARGSSTPLHFKREDEGGAAFINQGISSANIGANGFGSRPRRREVPGAETVDPSAAAAAPNGGVPLAGADGDENLSKAALKNKKKREAKKAKEAEAKASGLVPEANGDGGQQRNNERSRSKSGSGPQGPVRGQSHRGEAPSTPAKQAPAPAAAATPAPEVTVSSPIVESSQDKKVRALLKKLRAIDDLKMRQAGGEKLENTQVSKISTEEGVRKELSALGYNE